MQSHFDGCSTLIKVCSSTLSHSSSQTLLLSLIPVLFFALLLHCVHLSLDFIRLSFHSCILSRNWESLNCLESPCRNMLLLLLKQELPTDPPTKIGAVPSLMASSFPLSPWCVQMKSQKMEMVLSRLESNPGNRRCKTPRAIQHAA